MQIEEWVLENKTIPRYLSLETQTSCLSLSVNVHIINTLQRRAIRRQPLQAMRRPPHRWQQPPMTTRRRVLGPPQVRHIGPPTWRRRTPTWRRRLLATGQPLYGRQLLPTIQVKISHTRSVIRHDIMHADMRVVVLRVVLFTSENHSHKRGKNHAAESTVWLLTIIYIYLYIYITVDT